MLHALIGCPFREAIWVSGFGMNAIGQFAYFAVLGFSPLYAMRSFRFDRSAWANVGISLKSD